ncbi:MAG: class I SAM-dependent methyltransferase, partial [Candidatus Omnitrophica bacterium]|nr:class I SAM-dependent methyltransferase [Candidatus Omnitrophota bacterium]
DVDVSFFDELGENDILFVDSSHVSKTGSDVNHILFNILPKLNKGVLIHFHDIFYPFEYPKPWVLEGRCWNEDYLLRAFLSYNNSFEIVVFNTFLEHFHEDWFKENMPLCLKNKGGSIWLRKI